MSQVTTRWENQIFPTYQPAAPDPNPMFLEKRVYQGSSGKVYPLPFYDRIAEQPIDQAWEVLIIENEFLEVTIIPALGGRIHRMVDKTNGYDVIYYQPVIKPALVGLAGPWISGGIEFNWPQHHRPSTFMPADVWIQNTEAGSITVWLSEHDPMARMKGMHGVCLHPGKSYLELKGRVYNRTEDVQTFLWWANVATRVHDQYQSFFPEDASHVADHAKRATSTFPLCSGSYYGVDYAKRANLTEKFPAANDLSWYANIPVPTSYMCMGSQQNFFGGYDFREQAGIVHVANHHIAPGKKQWTWGNDAFGYAWDRNLTDADELGEFRPYIELMAGVYTDNQPDFSYLQPGETKSWRQYWYPIRAIGPAHHADREVAISLMLDDGLAKVGVASTAAHSAVRIELSNGSDLIEATHHDLSPAHPLTWNVRAGNACHRNELRVRVILANGSTLADYQPAVGNAMSDEEIAKLTASEPPTPQKIRSLDELYITGLHLEQYRHATRCPAKYWQEALRRDPLDSRCNMALGRWHLRRGELDLAENYLRRSIQRLTLRNPNPADGQAFYQLGRCLRLRDDNKQAYAAFYKATWDQAWSAASHHALAEMDCLMGDFSQALEHIDASLRLGTDNLRARNLKAMILQKLRQNSSMLVRETLELDPLDHWARHLAGEPFIADAEVCIDLALDFSRSGFYQEALYLISLSPLHPQRGMQPSLLYLQGWIQHQLENHEAAASAFSLASVADGSLYFPSRLEEQCILECALSYHPDDVNAHTALGHWLYDRRRHREAIYHWENAVNLRPGHAVVWRCLGIAYFNISQKPRKALAAYQNARLASPEDARLLYEADQLAKRLGITPSERLETLQSHPELIHLRDDLCIELCCLYNQSQMPDKALDLIQNRNFQPWEGGEGGPLGQFVRAHLLLGSQKMFEADFVAAENHFRAALQPPLNLGEAKHLLANQSDIHLALGDALHAAGRTDEARDFWHYAASTRGDFQLMSVREHSEMSYFSALALQRLGHSDDAKSLLKSLLRFAKQLAKTEAKIDYFATSLPTMLLFDEDLQHRQNLTAMFLEAQARRGLGQYKKARALLLKVLKHDPNHAMAADLLSAQI
ncbi:MAG: DUF5107 domain-containing protein [Verrucomicrobia bacterium]|nr:MAG: DUF5107 domain-containing protein [Verrucomicrobiota bacterium]